VHGSALISVSRQPRSTPVPYTTLFRSREGSSFPGSRARMTFCSSSLHGPLGTRRAGSCRESSLRTQFRTAEASMARLLPQVRDRSEEHTSELQSRFDLVCRLLLEKKKS